MDIKNTTKQTPDEVIVCAIRGLSRARSVIAIADWEARQIELLRASAQKLREQDPNLVNAKLTLDLIALKELIDELVKSLGWRLTIGSFDPSKLEAEYDNIHDLSIHINNQIKAYASDTDGK